MKRLLVILVVVAAIAAALVGGAYWFLAVQDHEVIRARVESALEHALGRDVHLGRPLEIAVTPSPVIRIHDAWLGNAAWSDESTMLTIESIDLRPRFRSLLRGEIVLSDLFLRGARLRLENGPDGRGNWQFDVGKGDEEASLPVRIRSLGVSDLSVTYVSAAEGDLRELRIGHLTMGAATPEADIAVRLAGEALGLPLAIEGSIGRFSDLVAGRPYAVDLDATFGATTLAVDGQILDPDFRDFEGIELAFEAEGERPVLLMEWTDIGIPELDRFSASGRVVGRGGRLSVREFDGDFRSPDFHMRISGDVEHVPEMSGMSLSFDAESDKITEWLPWRNQPVIVDGRFAASGRLLGDLRDIRLDPVRLSAETADSMIELEGTLGSLSEGGVVDARVRLESASPSALREETGIPFPRVDYLALSGRLTGAYLNPRLDQVDVTLREKGVAVRLEGEIGELVPLSGIALRFGLEGSNIQDLEAILKVEGLPSTDSAVATGLLRGRKDDLTLVVDNARLTDGGVQLDFSGQLLDVVDEPRLDMAIRLAGTNIRELTPVAETLVPDTDSFSINGRLVGRSTVPDLVDVDARARAGNSTLTLSGNFPDVLNLPQIDARFVIEGDDLAAIGDQLERPWPRSQTYRFSGRALGSPSRPSVEDIDGMMETEEVRVETNGRIGDVLEARDFDLQVRARAGSLVPFLPWGGYLWEALGESRADFGLTGGPDTFRVELDRLTAGRTVLQGRFDLSLDEARDLRGMVGAFSESSLDLTPWLEYEADPSEGDVAEDRKPSQRPVFSANPVPLSWLEGLTLDVDLEAVDLVFGAGVLEVKSGRLEVADQVMALDPFEVVYRDSLIEGGLEIDARAIPKLKSRMHSNGFDLGDLVRQAGISDVAKGLVDVELTVDAEGSSPQAMAGSASGHFGLLMTEGFLGEAALALHLTSIITTLMPFVEEQRGFEIKCGMLDFEIAQGIAKSNLLVLDTNDMLMKGKGSLDLGRERYDLLLIPRAKRARVLAHNVDVRVTGPFREPRISYDARAAGVRALGTLGRFALLGPAGLFVSTDTFRETRQDCAETLADVARMR
jgi:uncharacterized protein involved in outer membrane biogenesis